MLALHGGGEYGSDGLLQTTGGLARAIHQHADRFPAIVVFPQAHADNTPGWQKQGGQAALAAVDKAIAEFNGDPARVYLTGFSAGGNGREVNSHGWIVRIDFHLAAHSPPLHGDD